MESKQIEMDSTPTPKTEEFPSHKYLVPTKYIKSMINMGNWPNSKVYHDLIGFISRITVAIQGKSVFFNSHIAVTVLLIVLKKFIEFTNKTPPIGKFGNQANRVWLKKWMENSESYLKKALHSRFHPAVPEIVSHFTEFLKLVFFDYHIAATVMLIVLEKFMEFIDKTPPIDETQRFGTQANRVWLKKMMENSESFLKKALHSRFHPAVPEIVFHLTECFKFFFVVKKMLVSTIPLSRL